MALSVLELVAAVKAHAHANYNGGGWDVIVECWTDEEIADVIVEDSATTVEEALACFAPLVDVWSDRQAEARSHRDEALSE